MEQGSPEWFAARLGKVTASRIADVMARTKSGYAASRGSYMAELISERLSGTSYERFQNAAMQWGNDKEPEARVLYELLEDVSVAEVGFIEHPSLAMTGASPDGHIGEVGMVEIKCPMTHTHIETLIHNMVDTKYVYQMQWQMACTGRQWCDFFSFDPRMPVSMRYFKKRFHRDAQQIADIEREVRTFLLDLDQKIATLRQRYPEQAAA
jgi:putative phage-type endonuclease